MPAALVPAVAGIGAGDGSGTVELRLAAGGGCVSGRPTSSAPSWPPPQTVLEQVDTACLAVLDVRVPSAPTVTRSC